MTENVLSIAQLVLAILLTASILMQSNEAGLGAGFGGDGNTYRTKRGLEKKIFHATIVFSILFFGVALANTLL